MAALGDVADQQTPALRDAQRRRRPARRRFFNNLGPFADASPPGVQARSARPSQTGDKAVKAAGAGRRAAEHVRHADAGARASNLAIVLEHLDDRELRGREGPALARAARATPASRRCSSTSTTRCSRSTSTTATRHILKVVAVRPAATARTTPTSTRRPRTSRALKDVRRRASARTSRASTTPDTTRARRRRHADAVAAPQQPHVARRPVGQPRHERAAAGAARAAASARRRRPRRRRADAPKPARRPACRQLPTVRPARAEDRPATPTSGASPTRPARPTRPLLDYLLGHESGAARASIVANPVLVGAVTTLVVIVAVFLAYNANNGLPFVPDALAARCRSPTAPSSCRATRCAPAASASAWSTT